MLNRTNRTLSANLNGLNLGTRSFLVADFAATGLNTGSLALRLRHTHPQQRATFTPRDEDIDRIDPCIMDSIPAMPSCSPPASWRSSRSERARARVEVVAEALPRVRPVVVGVPATDPSGRGGRGRGQSQPQAQASQGSPKAQPKSKRWAAGSYPGAARGALAFASDRHRPVIDRNTFAPGRRLSASGG